MEGNCLIWGEGSRAEIWDWRPDGKWHVLNSNRVGGGYVIGSVEKLLVPDLSELEKARLTTWILDQHQQGVELPEITRATIQYAKLKQPLRAHERASRLLQWIADETLNVGGVVEVSGVSLAALAHSESVSLPEVQYLLRYLEGMGWINIPTIIGVAKPQYSVVVTVDGHSQIEEQETNALFNQGFVAMWFNDLTKEAYENGILPGIEDARYKPYRVDKDEHIDKIDDKIIAEIRRSRFIVADFTHGDEGARGGVYYEAGFAHGLGKQVIFTCRADQWDKLHFDTRQYNHIFWNTPEELREALNNRIRRLLGEGPE